MRQKQVDLRVLIVWLQRQRLPKPAAVPKVSASLAASRGDRKRRRGMGASTHMLSAASPCPASSSSTALLRSPCVLRLRPRGQSQSRRSCLLASRGAPIELPMATAARTADLACARASSVGSPMAEAALAASPNILSALRPSPPFCASLCTTRAPRCCQRAGPRLGPRDGRRERVRAKKAGQALVIFLFIK